MFNESQTIKSYVEKKKTTMNLLKKRLQQRKTNQNQNPHTTSKKKHQSRKSVYITRVDIQLSTKTRNLYFSK